MSGAIVVAANHGMPFLRLGPLGKIMATRNPGSTHQLRLVVYPCISHYLQGFKNIQKVVGNGISEPSTVCQVLGVGWKFCCP